MIDIVLIISLLTARFLTNSSIWPDLMGAKTASRVYVNKLILHVVATFEGLLPSITELDLLRIRVCALLNRLCGWLHYSQLVVLILFRDLCT